MAKFGGKQPGAGRPKGMKNKKTIEFEKALAKHGLTPLEYMLQVMCNQKLPIDIRLDAAKSAAPYVHPRLASVEFKGAVDLNHAMIPEDIQAEQAQTKYLELMGVSSPH